MFIILSNIFRITNVWVRKNGEHEQNNNEQDFRIIWYYSGLKKLIRLVDL